MAQTVEQELPNTITIMIDMFSNEVMEYIEFARIVNTRLP